MSHQSNGNMDQHNTARFFVEQRHVAWVMLVGTMLWGIYAWIAMPQRKDPEIPVRAAAVLCTWPGASAEMVEERITRRIEEAIGGNSKVKKIQSTSRTGQAVVTFDLVEEVAETGPVMDDVGFRLEEVRPLPDGASPLVYIKDFGETATLMLTVASPKASPVEVDVRARAIAELVAEVRKGARGTRQSVAWVAPDAVDPAQLQRQATRVGGLLMAEAGVRDARVRATRGAVVLDVDVAGMPAGSSQGNSAARPSGASQGGATTPAAKAGAAADTAAQGQDGIAATLRDKVRALTHQRLGSGALHPDLWEPAVIGADHTPATVAAHLGPVAGDKYSWRELEAWTELARRTLQAVPTVAKVSRWGVRAETVYVDWSQERLAALGVDPQKLGQVLAARNVSLPGGVLETEGRMVLVDPKGELGSAKELGDVLLTTTPTGAPLYLRDVAEVTRSYADPATNINYFYAPDADGHWQRNKAVSLAVEMRSGQQIRTFSTEVDKALDDLRTRLPEDLQLERTSDQPLQVREKIDLFSRSLGEAVLLVVAVAFIGFREWRSALIMALSIPLTLAMTFGMMHLLHIDLQQISIASLILALGLLVDDPVVAGDAIKREMSEGKDRNTAAWLGPTKLAKAILYATVTNIVAYLPFLLLTGDKGRFLYSMPVVVAASLVASRLVSMTFIPLLGAVLLKAVPEPSIEERRKRGIGKFYYAVGGWAIDHRWKVLLCSLVLVFAGCKVQSQLKPQFFPKDLSYLSYVDLWLPEDATVESSRMAADEAVRIVRETASQWEVATGRASKGLPPALKHVTTFVGGGGPRFWFSVTPELRQPNYAQLLIEVSDSYLTKDLVGPFQQALSAQLPGVRADVQELENGPPIGVPVQIRLFGEHLPTLRAEAEKLHQLLEKQPGTIRVRDNWGSASFRARLDVDSDKASLAGLTSLDVARTTSAASQGATVTVLNEGRLRIPVVTRLRADDRAGAQDLESLYVMGASGTRVPLGSVASISYDMETTRIFHRNQQRCMVVSAFPAQGVLPSEVVSGAMAQLKAFEKELPPGFRMEIGGEYEEQVKGFLELAMVMAVSVGLIYLALLMQFRNAVKPLIVFAAIPFGMTGAFVALRAMGQPFGFMAFLGIASLIGVIVSHIIVLFDFIEEKREEGEDLRSALLDAGIVRLRPVMITVAATVIALLPLATHGGPLWEPLCYAQAGGLTFATFVTLLIVPVLYAIAVFDLKIIK